MYKFTFCVNLMKMNFKTIMWNLLIYKSTCAALEENRKLQPANKSDVEEIALSSRIYISIRMNAPHTYGCTKSCSLESVCTWKWDWEAGSWLTPPPAAQICSIFYDFWVSLQHSEIMLRKCITNQTHFLSHTSKKVLPFHLDGINAWLRNGCARKFS